MNSPLSLSGKCVHTLLTLVLLPASSEAEFIGLHYRLKLQGLLPPSSITHSIEIYQGRALMQGSLTISCLQFTRWQSVWRRWASLWWRPGGPWRAMEIKFSVWTGAKIREELWALPRYAVGQLFPKLVLGTIQISWLCYVPLFADDTCVQCKCFQGAIKAVHWQCVCLESINPRSSLHLL